MTNCGNVGWLTIVRAIATIGLTQKPAGRGQRCRSACVPASFQFGGLKRRDPVRTFQVQHGDVAVWGAVSRLAYHGIADLKDGEHARLGSQRINLTCGERFRTDQVRERHPPQPPRSRSATPG